MLDELNTNTIHDLIAELTKLSAKTGADVEARSLLPAPAIFWGSHKSDYGPDETLTYEATVRFLIRADPHNEVVTVRIDHWTNDEETDCGNPWFSVDHSGRSAITKANKIVRAIKRDLRN